MDNQDDDLLADMSPTNAHMNKLIKSKAEAARNTPSVDKSRQILNLCAANGYLPEDDEAIQFCPNCTSSSCRATSCGRGASQSSGETSAIVFSRALRSSKNEEPVKQHARKLIFYGQEKEHLQIFNQEVDKATKRRFEEICPHLEGAVLKYLRAERCNVQGTAVHLRILGATEDAAKPWIVVHCPEGAMKKAHKFLGKEFVRRMCQGQIVFDTVVCCSLRPAYSEDADEVFIEQDGLETHGAWPPQIKVTKSGMVRYATLGGFAFVTMTDGKTLMYGITAGHVLPSKELNNAGGNLPPEEDSENDESDDDSIVSSTDGNSTDWCLDAGDISTLSGSSGSQDEVSVDLEHRSWTSLGYIATFILLGESQES